MVADGSAAEAPRVSIPRDYNAAVDLVGRHLPVRASKTAFIDDRASLTYAQLAERVDRAANALRKLGIEPENRIALCPLNTLLTANDYDFMLRDSRAKALIVSDALYEKIAPVLANQPALKHVIVSGEKTPAGRLHFSRLLAEAEPRAKAAPTTCDDVCFWLYSSGSTGTPKGTVHLQSHLILTAELYAIPVLGIRETDTV